MSEITVNDLGGDEGGDELVPFTAPTMAPSLGVHGGEEEGIRFPFFGIIHGIGSSFASFPKNVGDFIYNGLVLVEKPVEISFYGTLSLYVQNLVYDAQGPQPNKFRTVQEVLAAGGNVKPGVSAGQDDNNYRCSESVCSAVVFAPKKSSWANGLDLVIPNGNELLVPVTWTLRKTAHWALNPTLKMTDAALRKAGKSLPFQRWKLDTRTQKYGSGNSTILPVLTKIEKLNDPATVELITSGFGG